VKDLLFLVGKLCVIRITIGVKLTTLADEVLLYITRLVTVLQLLAGLSYHFTKPYSLFFEEIHDWVFVQL
jgi:hypothetical protein